jgi:hypothetical protein
MSAVFCARYGRLVSILAVAAMAAGFLVVLPQKPAHAWKPPTHLLGTEAALDDVLADGSVTINSVDGRPPVTVPANPTIVRALREYPEAYRAGSVGPDAYPDIYFGSTAVHPDTCTENDAHPTPSQCYADDTSQTWEWFMYLWEKAWDPSTPEAQRLENISFALGYMGGHGVGDLWAHTWVNEYAGGVAPGIVEFERTEVLVRHLVIETYVDKHRPGADQGSSYALSAPTDFVADTLILSDFSRSKSSNPFFDMFFSMQDGLADAEDEIEDDMSSQDVFGECPACFPDPTDAPINLVELGFLAIANEYLEAWQDDIDRGLRAWPKLGEVIAQELMSGKDPDVGRIKSAAKEWIQLYFLSMMGLPDAVGEGDYLLDTIIEYVQDLISGVLGFVFDIILAIPVIGELVEAIIDLYDKAKEFIDEQIEALESKICDMTLGAFFDVTDSEATLGQFLDKNGDGDVSCEEYVAPFKNPVPYIVDSRLFAPGSRARMDADMHLQNGLDPDATVAAGRPIVLDGADDDVNGYFRNYDPNLFAPLRNTITMAKLALLDEHGLNQFVQKRAGGLSSLGNLYPAHAPLHVSYPVPQNIMLGSPTGWIKAIDAEYQYRTNSPHDGHSYGTGEMLMWEDCVSRVAVFRTTFMNPSSDVDGMGDAGDPPSPIMDIVAPVSILTTSGPSVTNGATTYVSGSTDIQIASTDNFWAKPDLRVNIRSYPTGTAPPGYLPGVPADPAPFTLAGEDGSKTVDYFAIDGRGSCKAEDVKSAQFSLDNTPPVVTVTSPVPPKTDYASDALLPLSFSATDAGAGVDAATARHFADGVEQFPIPATIDLFDYPAGDHVYTAQQADLLGNLGVANVPWRTVVTQGSLAANLDKAFLQRGCITQPGVYSSLKQKLAASKAADDRGQDTASDDQLKAFINELEAQSGKAVTEYCAGILISNAAFLVDA